MENLKKATTVQEQIETLRARGMCIDDEKKAIENLSDIGYYRLGFYWFPFEKTYPRKKKRDHIFQEGTNFDFAIKLYYFDFDLRNLFLRYIGRIEINFRTTLIYMISNKFKDDPFWYINSKVLKKDFIDSELFQKSLKDINSEPVIKQDLNMHRRQYAPAWKAIEYMSFGVVISIYDSLLDGGLKHDISVVYGMQSPSQFSSYINTIRRLRNYCAHGKVLFDMTLPEAISNGPLGYLGNQKNILVGAYKVFCYFLGKISQNRVTEMKAELLKAFDRVTYQPVKDIIYNNSGFRPNDL